MAESLVVVGVGLELSGVHGVATVAGVAGGGRFAWGEARGL